MKRPSEYELIEIHGRTEKLVELLEWICEPTIRRDDAQAARELAATLSRTVRQDVNALCDIVREAPCE